MMPHTPGELLKSAGCLPKDIASAYVKQGARRLTVPAVKRPHESSPEPTDQSYGDEQEEVKQAYTTSAYSGPLSYGSFKQESQIPAFRSPAVKTSGPPSQYKGKLEKKAYDPSPLNGPGTLGNVHLPGMSKMKTPASQLQQSKGVAKVPSTKPMAGKAFSTKLPTIGSSL